MRDWFCYMVLVGLALLLLANDCCTEKKSIHLRNYIKINHRLDMMSGADDVVFRMKQLSTKAAVGE